MCSVDPVDWDIATSGNNAAKDIVPKEPVELFPAISSTIAGINGASVMIDEKDPNGVEFIRQIIDVAEMGLGFDYYIYPDPAANMTEKLKLSFVENVDGTWFLGSGIYAVSEGQ